MIKWDRLWKQTQREEICKDQLASMYQNWTQNQVIQVPCFSFFVLCQLFIAKIMLCNRLFPNSVLRDNYLLLLIYLGLTGLGWGSSSETDVLLLPPGGSRPILMWAAEMQEIMPYKCNSTSAFHSFVITSCFSPMDQTKSYGQAQREGAGKFYLLS